MINDAVASLRDMFSSPFRTVLFKSLGLTLLLLAMLWLALERFAIWAATGGAPWFAGAPWLKTVIEVAAGLGLFVGLIFLIAPVVLLVAGFFLDELADHVEARIYPDGRRGHAVPPLTSMVLAIKFSGVALLVNLLAFALWLLPGFNALVFFVANAYLFSREYFQLAAMRFQPLEDARALRRANRLMIFVAGLMIALFVATPVLNLLTPLFGVGLMARVYKRLTDPRTAPRAVAPR
ncbi:sulfate transporter family protein [Rhodoblastus acidophilus]|uniref:Sulfate transporter family protein n=1 Tax=Candidatus Rhodoblastus alkanivorans TaxID=2954117 RepID=A0ABS9Z2R7_9HYPH|nr:sulfate transporter family protein [Candidatus Rhodoblastus alkanivorans]MCI4679732.1 sulfate transporter family protein [Candidatus Rhodoblastus alkanivorans]MCI4681970.1 sulfate transporter family protein [Candidatus Rhodoblastus alkanivorans]MDI4643021.1 sulfate transporter family protein [Rhodoblastus acidophilus]